MLPGRRKSVDLRLHQLPRGQRSSRGRAVRAVPARRPVVPGRPRHRQGRAPHVHRRPHVRHRREPGPPQVARLRAAGRFRRRRASSASPSSTARTRCRVRGPDPLRASAPCGARSPSRRVTAPSRRTTTVRLWRVSARSEPRLLQFVIENGPGLRLVEPRGARRRASQRTRGGDRRPWLRPAPPIERDA